MMTVLALLGTTGALGLGALWYFFPSVFAGVVTGALQTVLTGASWLASNTAEGLQGIFADWRKLLALIVVALGAGWYGDRYDPVRPYVPTALQSKPSKAATAPRRRAPLPRKKAQKAPTSSGDVICNAVPYLCSE